MSELEILERRFMLLEEEVERIKGRNKKVEFDKAWEVSRCRVLSITALTYAIAVLLFLALGVKEVFLSALIPTVGYFLSTQSLPFIKHWWIGRNGL